jgi:hypothetical protein
VDSAIKKVGSAISPQLIKKAGSATILQPERARPRRLSHSGGSQLTRLSCRSVLAALLCQLLHRVTACDIDSGIMMRERLPEE